MLRGYGKLLKYCIGIAPDEANLKHFAYDIVEEISSNRGTSNEINNVQTAISTDEVDW